MMKNEAFLLLAILLLVVSCNRDDVIKEDANRTSKFNKHLIPQEKALSSLQETLTMVHCVFGWKGLGNGYFVSGIFYGLSQEADFDTPTSTPAFTYNFKWHLKTITYDNPRK